MDDWFTCDKKSLIDSGLVIDRKDHFVDGTEFKTIIGKIEKCQITIIDETDYPFSTVPEKEDQDQCDGGIQYKLKVIYSCCFSNILSFTRLTFL